MVTKPRTGQTPSKATLAKLSTATYTYGKDLSVRNPFVAPDGGSVADYPKGWRFLPTTYELFTPEQGYASGRRELVTTEEQLDKLKNHPKVIYHMDRLHNLGGVRTDASGSASYHKQQIANYHYELVISPQIKADQEFRKKEKEEQGQIIATLKMRVQELEKRPAPTPTAPAVTSSLPIIPIIIIAVIVGIFLLRRRK